MHLTPMARSRAGRFAWSLLRHPRSSRGYPARLERLATREDLLRLA